MTIDHYRCWRQPWIYTALITKATNAPWWTGKPLLRHSSADSQHPSINVDDAHLQFHHVEAWLLQRGTGRSNALRPWPTAVCHQCRSSSHGGCAALRPHLTFSRRPSLAADGRTYTVQALCTCIPLPTRSSAMLPSTDSLSGGEHGITASSAVSHIIWPDGACYTKVNTAWPCLRCSQTTGLEQPSGHHPSLFIIGNFQTFTQVPPFSAVLFAQS